MHAEMSHFTRSLPDDYEEQRKAAEEYSAQDSVREVHLSWTHLVQTTGNTSQDNLFNKGARKNYVSLKNRHLHA